MSGPTSSGDAQKYERELLLLGPKRTEVLELLEVQRYGIDSFGNRDHVSIFGMRPSDWYVRGVRLLGRTAVECTRDALADLIGQDIAALCTQGKRATHVQIIDPFLGSANSLYWILHHLPTALGLGVELDPIVCGLTKQNLAALSLPIQLVNADYRLALTNLALLADEQVIVFVAPPWGDALSQTSGLNLRNTTPPIMEVVNLLIDLFGSHSLLCAIQILEHTDAGSLDEVRTVFDWSLVRLYDLYSSYGLRPGILLGTKGWTPSAPIP